MLGVALPEASGSLCSGICVIHAEAVFFMGFVDRDLSIGVLGASGLAEAAQLGSLEEMRVVWGGGSCTVSDGGKHECACSQGFSPAAGR